MSKLLGDSVGESAAVGADEDDATMEKVDGFDEAAAEPNPLFGRESSENMPTKENRINKRPRRSSTTTAEGERVEARAVRLAMDLVERLTAVSQRARTTEGVEI
jgi:hypothetical protein